MNDTRSGILSAAEHTFDRHGFAASGMDRLTDAANVSSRTLYKHLGGKNALIVAVLDARRERFFAALRVNSVDGLFDALERWTTVEGTRGCFFLRAQGEDVDRDGAIASSVSAYRTQLHELIRHIVRTETGNDDDTLTEQILVLFEGATSAASYRGPKAILAAKAAARTLLAGSAERSSTSNDD